MDEFEYGRRYQLVVDKTKTIPPELDRRYQILRYIKSLTRDEIIEESKNIVNSHQKKIELYQKKIEIRQKYTDFYQKNIELYQKSGEKKVECGHSRRGQMKIRKYNDFDKLNLEIPESYKNEFYLGRCVQFLLDTNNKIEWNDIITKTEEEIIDMAHEAKTKILYPKEGDAFKINGCYNCSYWSYGHKRCSCGNRRYYYYDMGPVATLDDTELEGYAEPY